MSESVKPSNLSEALCEFQFKCPSIDKDAEVEVKTNAGSSYKFKYASYGNIVQTIRPALHECGLSYTFPSTGKEFICRIKHTNGEFQDTVIEMPKMKDKMQENGSNFTYLMRYALKLALGLDTDADDDGNTGDGNDVNFKTPPKEHIKDVNDYIQKKGKDIAKYVVRVGKFKDKKLSEIDQLDIQQYLSWLHGKAKENKQPLTGDWLEFAKIAEAYISGDFNNGSSQI